MNFQLFLKDVVVFFLWIAIINCHKLSGLEWQNFILSWFSGQKSEVKVWEGRISSQGSREESPHLFPVSRDAHQFSAFLDLQNITPALPLSSPGYFPLCLPCICVSLSLGFSLLLRTPTIGFKAHCDLILTVLHLQRPCFQTESP